MLQIDHLECRREIGREGGREGGGREERKEKMLDSEAQKQQTVQCFTIKVGGPPLQLLLTDVSDLVLGSFDGLMFGKLHTQGDEMIHIKKSF